MQDESYACTEIANLTYQTNLISMRFKTLSLLHMMLFVILALSIDIKHHNLYSSKVFKETTQYCYIALMALTFIFIAFFHPSEDGVDLVSNDALCYIQERQDKRQFTSTLHYVFVYSIAVLSMLAWCFVSYQRLMYNRWAISYNEWYDELDERDSLNDDSRRLKAVFAELSFTIVDAQLLKIMLITNPNVLVSVLLLISSQTYYTGLFYLFLIAAITIHVGVPLR